MTASTSSSSDASAGRTSRPRSLRRRSIVRKILIPASILLSIWWGLTGTLSRAWIAGGVAVGIGVGLHLFLTGERTLGLRPAALLSFLPYYARQSLEGGWDVSRRALGREMRLHPTLLHHELSLPPGPSRIVFTNALSLLPGTVGADLRDDTLVVHLLVGGSRSEARVRELEERVGRLFEPAIR